VKIVIIRFPGTNCEFDTLYAFEKLGVSPVLVWHQEQTLPTGTDLVILPGGFSYGDHLRSGAIAHFSPVMRSVKEYANRGGYVLGICNGFQILLEIGLLTGAMKHNANMRFISKYVDLQIVCNQNHFLRCCEKESIVRIPVAHAEGNYYASNDEVRMLEDRDQVLLRYLQNPNGSVGDIAGICDQKKRIFGLMPHPERAIEKCLGSTDGARMLEGFLG
jgi:phosphoribosylformylglycinamidine synthase I